MTAICTLCGAVESAPLFESRDRIHNLPGIFTVFRCQRCEAVFYRPRLQPEELSRYYPDTYGRYRHSRSLGRKSYKGIRRFVLENAYGYPSREETILSPSHRWIALLLSLVMAKDALPYRGEGRFLDVGCGGGSYLHRLQQWGWDVYGVEPSSAGAAQARSLGLHVFQGELQEAGFAESFFDVVRLNHVLEHLTDPRRTLIEIRRILKPEGVVYISIPNTRSLNFWIFRENWYGLDAPRHAISYCPKALEFLCDASGFEIVRIRFRSGVFNFVRSMKYWIEERGNRGPRWLRRVNWPSNKIIRRTLKPVFSLSMVSI